jgi:hypothetical protein
MSGVLAANTLKTMGVSAIQKATSDGSEVLLTVRGKAEYVIMSIMEYNHLRECELAVAVAETKKDVKHKAYVTESVHDHMKRIRHG